MCQCRGWKSNAGWKKPFCLAPCYRPQCCSSLHHQPVGFVFKHESKLSQSMAWNIKWLLSRFLTSMASVCFKWSTKCFLDHQSPKKWLLSKSAHFIFTLLLLLPFVWIAECSMTKLKPCNIYSLVFWHLSQSLWAFSLRVGWEDQYHANVSLVNMNLQSTVGSSYLTVAFDSY